MLKQDLALKAHSNFFGGSISDRRMNCPGSWQAEMRLPVRVDLPSTFAEKGSFGHAVMEFLFGLRRQYPDIDLYKEARASLGQHFHDRVLTDEHLASMIIPALDMLAELEAAYGGGFEVVGIEERVNFPGVPGAFGTIDAILRNIKYVIYLDLKFGVGVPVKCVYKDANGELLNPQVTYYISAALNTIPELNCDRQIVGAIVQPLIEDGLDHTEIAREEITQFIEDVHRTVTIMIDRDPPLKRGDWCRWCPVKVSCREWTKAAIDLSHLGFVAPTKPKPGPSAYGDYLSKAKMLLDSLLLMKSEVDAQIVSYLENGGEVPGWKLKAKRKNRVWIEEAIVVPALEKLGFEEHEIWQKKLQAFNIADAAAKRLGVKIPDKLRVAPTTTDVVLATADDPAPALPDRKAMVAQFQQTLKKLGFG
jgi:hypothetical protein